MTDLAGVELGGTKCICVRGTDEGVIGEQIEVPTAQPRETLAAIDAILSRWDVAAVGIASFGPLDLDPGSPQYGSVINTTKAGWSGTRLASIAGGRPYRIDTDVNGAALAEGRWGGARSLTSWAYVTVGTGVGVGSIVSRQPIRGLGHSEAGHSRIPRSAGDDFAGICAYHRDCVEGLASGPAIEARAGMTGRAIPVDHQAWEFAADALAALCHNLLLTSLPERIFIGGGVAMGQPQLLQLIRARLRASLAGYSASDRAEPLETYIVNPALGDRAGPLGALALALEAPI